MISVFARLSIDGLRHAALCLEVLPRLSRESDCRNNLIDIRSPSQKTLEKMEIEQPVGGLARLLAQRGTPKAEKMQIRGRSKTIFQVRRFRNCGK